jgi:hypothetical protein
LSPMDRHAHFGQSLLRNSEAGIVSNRNKAWD